MMKLIDVSALVSIQLLLRSVRVVVFELLDLEIQPWLMMWRNLSAQRYGKEQRYLGFQSNAKH